MSWALPGLLQASSASSSSAIRFPAVCDPRVPGSGHPPKAFPPTQLYQVACLVDSPEAMEAAASSPSASAVLLIDPVACASGSPFRPAPFTTRILFRRARSPR
jgi:hypothetical protein